MTSDTSLLDQLEKSRRELLDLTTRNRLISTSRTSSRSSRLEIEDELSNEVFRTLVSEKKAMTFLPSRKSIVSGDVGEEVSEQLAQPGDDLESSVASRHTDRYLQTLLPSEQLQRRLLKLYYDARTYEEEQGVNSLYLALGFLKWYEDEKSDRERYAPLLLIPVALDRRSANAKFRLSYTEDEITTNLSLQAKLKTDFGITLPDVPEVEELRPDAYFADVAHAISGQPRWEILANDIVLWFYSFAKFLMYRDLQPETWPDDQRIEQHALIRGLLHDGFRGESRLCSDADKIDDLIAPLDMIHVLDADSSQTLAIEEVKRGQNLVIQGPPGTGKSQTIANLIATAVKDGKTVLFVAEKMAALEVVKRRLDNIGLGDICLELHSHCANKRAVLENLRQTVGLTSPRLDDIERQAEELQRHRDRLNRHAAIMHTYLEPAKITPYQALGELVRLRASGAPPADFVLADALQWTTADVRERQNALEDFANHVSRLSDPATHPWRGVRLQSILPTERDRITASLPGIIARMELLMEAAETLAGLLRYGTVNTLLDCSAVAQCGQRFIKAPPMDRRSLAHSVWFDRREEIADLVQTGCSLGSHQSALRETCAEVAWSTDVTAARRHLAAHGQRWLRIFSRDYRQAQATLRGILRQSPPKSLEARLRILDSLIEGQKAHRAVAVDEHNHHVGTSAFGSYWRRDNSNWQALEQIVQWEAGCHSASISIQARQAFADLDNLDIVDRTVQIVGRELKPLFTDLNELLKRLNLDRVAAFGEADIRIISLQALRARLQGWLKHAEAITHWINYAFRKKRLEAQGMSELTQRLDDGTLDPRDAVSRFRVAYYEAVMGEIFRRHPDLAIFEGTSHERLMLRFRELDEERIALARQEVAMVHFQRLPAFGGEVGETGVLAYEMKKKQRHLPVRKLLRQAGRAVQAIKPVFMMSPISIAQYLQPGVLDFDLLLIDEASQVRPVDALGAVARAKQIVVVGDDRQLPPTNFFGRMMEEDSEETEGNDFQTHDLESILGLCEAQNMPRRMLQWHYRSRHHSLIAVSNREFYDDKLYVVPSPFSSHSGIGLCFHPVRDGVFDRGGSATNRVEACAVAEAVLDHARNYPDLSLGVAAFSMAQRDAILDALELLRRENSDLESFFATDVPEPFFVKNLENIQGDERDVIFISVGYGRDVHGYMAMNFGPLNNEGGERRLNVLISRAKKRCEVFSSITADDIDLNRAKSRGVQSLKSFLAYAQTGYLGGAARSTGDYESEFEREVARALEAHDWKVDAQVGVAGFFIDLAVVDPELPGRYLLGIECDGATYHSSRSARDRDRLRQQVLEDRGWIVHRIWSTDWFHRPEEQLAKALMAIESAKATWASRASESPLRPARQDMVQERMRIERQEDYANDSADSPAIEAAAYIEADFPVSLTCEIHELATHTLADIVTQIVEIEGPIHEEEIQRRVVALCGQRRTGKRIAAAIEAAIEQACDMNRIVRDRAFLSLPTQTQFPFRNRAEVRSANLKKRPALVPHQEIQAALLEVIRVHLGTSNSEAVTQVARLLGFRATSQELRRVIEDEINLLVEQRLLELKGGRLTSVKSATSPVEVQ